jgi:DNA repair protein RadC
MKAIYKQLKCRVCLVKEGKPKKKHVITKPEDVFKLVRNELGKSDREMFLSIMLSVRNVVIGIETVSIGILNASLVSPRELFKSAILANSANLILVHNHPSGDTEPSPEDLALTKRITEAGKLLNIEVIDHVIVTKDSFLSLKENNQM